MTNDTSTPSPVRTHSKEEREQITRFIGCLGQAMTDGRLSQRDLCARMGVTIGSLTKYLRGGVAPMKVGTGIQANLAAVLGISLDALVRYLRTGSYRDHIGREECVTWLIKSAELEDMAAVSSALGLGLKRLMEINPVPPPAAPELYTWPIEELTEIGISKSMRDRMGLTEEALNALAEYGTFDDDLVEAFSLACNYDRMAVMEAFQQRKSIA